MNNTGVLCPNAETFLIFTSCTGDYYIPTQREKPPKFSNHKSEKKKKQQQMFCDMAISLFIGTVAMCIIVSTCFNLSHVNTINTIITIITINNNMLH